MLGEFAIHPITSKLMSTTTIYQDGTYLARNPTWHGEDSAWKAERILKMFRMHAIEPTSLCEIGCGSGEMLQHLSQHFQADVLCIGYDISPQAYAMCKPKETRNLRFALKNVFECEDAAFHVILSVDVFEHVEDYIGFLRELKKKATYKVFHIPLDLSVQSVFRGSRLLHWRSLYGHLHYFTKDTALATLRDTGYDVIDHVYTSGSLELPTGGWKAKLIKVPRKLLFQLHADLAARLLGGFSLLVLAK